MSFTLCTSGAAIFLAGKYAESSVTSNNAILNNWSDQAEGAICAATRRDWILLSGSTLTNFRGILNETAACAIAKKIINYEMGVYTSRTEAQTMLDMLTDIYKNNISVLSDEKNKEKMIS